MKSFPDFSLENESGYELVAGVDEAGRGPLCGPVVAAAVIFPSPGGVPRGARRGGRLSKEIIINDSKKMSAHQREDAYEFLTTHPDVIWAAALCTPAEIDELNILRASLLAMKRATDALGRAPEFVLVDGNRLPPGICPPTGPQNRAPTPPKGGVVYCSLNSEQVGAELLPPWGESENASLVSAPHFPVGGQQIPGLAVVHGDAKSLSIAAASVIAKVTRDRIMCELAREFPQYGWDKNAGYPTASHLQAIEKYGINRHYRKTFGPVKKLLTKDI
ncbi:MAG: ribonuclease HII [Proteobacteria bacterium]|nr:ribonuclease HII [Pseudomonadota bacterium]